MNKITVFTIFLRLYPIYLILYQNPSLSDDRDGFKLNQEHTFSGGIRLVASMIKCTNEDTRLRLVQGWRSRALLNTIESILSSVDRLTLPSLNLKTNSST
jgi:hypothetical protein